MKEKVYARLARLFDAYQRNIETGNLEWRDKHQEEIDSICENHLPSGSGFDSGTTFDYDRSRPNRLVLNTSYHHMDDGYYAGWTDHTVTVKASLASGFDLVIGGRDRNEIKDYIAETFQHFLSEEI